MDRISPTPSFEGGPTLDSRTRLNSGIALQTSSTGSPLLLPRIVPQNPTNTHRVGPRERRAEYMAARMQTSEEHQYAYNDPSHVSQTLPRTSRPVSRPTSRPERVSRSPGEPYAQYRGEDNLDNEAVARALEPPRRRRTPSLRRAPRLQWDLSRPINTVPSSSTLRGAETEDDTSVDWRRRDGRRASQVEAPRQRPPAANQVQQTRTELDGHADAPQHHQDDAQLSKPQTSDPTHDSQTHCLSPIEECPELVTSRRRYRHRWHPTDSLPSSPEPNSPKLRSRLSYFLPSHYDGDNASLGSAEALDIQRVTNEQVRRGEITIPRGSARNDAPATISEAYTCWLAGDYIPVDAEGMRLLTNFRAWEDEPERVRREMRSFRRKAKRFWGKFKRLFGKEKKKMKKKE